MNSIDPIIDKDEEPLFIKCDCGSEMFEIRYLTICRPDT